MEIDSFSPVVAVPTKLGEFASHFYVTPGTPNTYRTQWRVVLFDAAGEPVQERGGNLTPHMQGWTLTAGQKNALAACDNVAQVMKLVQDFMLNKAEGALG